MAVNLTEACARMAAELNRLRTWNGLDVIEAWCGESEERKREGCKDDERSEEWTESYIKDYGLLGVHLDVYDLWRSDSEYVSADVDYGKIHKDFKAWMLQFLDGEESVIPEEINLEGHEMELIRPGAKFDNEI